MRETNVAVLPLRKEGGKRRSQTIVLARFAAESSVLAFSLPASCPVRFVLLVRSVLCTLAPDSGHCTCSLRSRTVSPGAVTSCCLPCVFDSSRTQHVVYIAAS